MSLTDPRQAGSVTITPGATKVPALAELTSSRGGACERFAARALDKDYLGVFVRGCAWGRLVRKLGDKYIVYDQDNKVIGEADAGFKPLPEDAEWVAKVEYAKANNLPHPYGWPKEKHADWAYLLGSTRPA